MNRIGENILLVFATNLELRYQENILNVKMTNPEDDNYSDDEQAFLTYYLFYFTTQHGNHGMYTVNPGL